MYNVIHILSLQQFLHEFINTHMSAGKGRRNHIVFQILHFF